MSGHFQLFFDDGTVAGHMNQTLKEVVIAGRTHQYRDDSPNPLKIVDPSGKILNWDPEAMYNFQQEYITEHELRELCECDALCRNIIPVGPPGDETDSHSLWMRRAGECILVDDDQDIRQPYDPESFYDI